MSRARQPEFFPFLKLGGGYLLIFLGGSRREFRVSDAERTEAGDGLGFIARLNLFGKVVRDIGRKFLIGRQQRNFHFIGLGFIT